MKILINTDKNVEGDQRQMAFFTAQIEEELKRFESHITRIEVHLKDENGPKDGLNDISCLIETRIEGRQPLAVSSQEDTVELAVASAIEKTITSMESILGKLQQH